MTTIRNFFSPTKTSLAMTPSPVQNEIKSVPVSRPDNKLIVSNMKSVINSVKLHQKKAKKRKRGLDEPQEIHDISNILQSNLSFISPNRTEPEQNTKETRKVTHPVRTMPDAKPDESPTSVDSAKENNSIDGDTTTPCSQSTHDETKSRTKSQTKANAFEFMMKARHKSIGNNSPGKELSNKDVTPDVDREVNVKRKLMLEEWAERKGRAKKRINEAADDAYIDTVMKKRARRLKTLLTNGKKPKEILISDEETVSQEPPNGIKLTVRKNKIEDSDDDSPKSSNRTLNGKKKGTKSVADENFIEILSSPLKKRDSLLGYFSKLTKTPTKNVPLATADSPSLSSNGIKKRGRPRRTLPTEETLDKPSKADNNHRKVTPSPPPTLDTSKPVSEGRPKRLCRDKKISYLIDEDYNSVRTREKKVIDKDYTTPKTAAKQSKPTKLAPIFAKAIPKPIIDPLILQARQDFLRSGIPEKMKLEIEKQRQFEEYYETESEVFPKISHVGHHVDSNNVDMDLSVMNIRFRRESVEDEKLTFSSDPNKILEIRKTESQEQPFKIDTSLDQKELMRELKQNDTSEFPYYRCFKQLKQKNVSQLSSEEDDGDNSIELVVEKVESTNGDELFTKKYRSMTTSEVIINSKPLIELKKFLSTWQENMDGREYMDSSDEFDTNSSSGMSALNKAIVLYGPPGVGKTMFVYALANEMNFKVLEINAGAKRTGKKVLQKLQEATQSHHVNNNQCSQSERKIVKSKSNVSEDSEDSGGTQKLSLILIEDAEVVFEQDFGFIDSINQLITTTKRPVILVTNEINCPHLSRFINRNMISFKSPKPTVASKWLSILSVVEKCYVTEDMCRTLYQQNNCDLRKTLLELQLFIQSTKRKCDNNDNTVVCTNDKLSDLFFKDQNKLDLIVPFPIDFTNLSNTTKKILNPQNLEEKLDEKATKENLHSLHESLEFSKIVSTAQWFDQKTDCSDRLINHLSEDISHFMVEQSIKIKGLERCNYLEKSINESESISRPQQLASSISSRNHHSTRGFDLDMEPCLRSICRSELLRSHRERRSSRFYHYLRGANMDSFGTKVLDEHCLIFSSE